MSAVIKTPVAIVTQADMDKWYQLQKQLEQIKAEEMALRKQIFAYYFDNPQEGTNTIPLSDGWVMKGNYKINRTVDAQLLQAHITDMRKKKIPVDTLFKFEPTLSTTEYRKLDEKQRKEVDSVLKISVGSPALEIVLPKRAPATPVA